MTERIFRVTDVTGTSGTMVGTVDEIEAALPDWYDSDLGRAVTEAIPQLAAALRRRECLGDLETFLGIDVRPFDPDDPDASLPAAPMIDPDAPTGPPTAPQPIEPWVSPRRGSTPVRTIRVPNDLWDAALAATVTRGDTISDVVRRALVEYVGMPQGSAS